MMLPPPGLLSTTTCWPSARDSFSAIRRQMISGVPPAACDTMNLIGRAGQLCAATWSDAASKASVPANAPISPCTKPPGTLISAAVDDTPDGRLVGRTFSVLQAAHDTIRSYRVVDL